MFTKAWTASLTATNIENGFVATMIYPDNLVQMKRSNMQSCMNNLPWREIETSNATSIEVGNVFEISNDSVALTVIGWLVVLGLLTL